MTLCIHNARIVSSGGVAPGGVLTGDGGRIAALLAADDRPSADTVIDATGRFLLPGFIDTDPRRSGGNFAAAALGGITSVLCAGDGGGGSPVHVDAGRLGVVAGPDACAALWRDGVIGFELADGVTDHATLSAILRECARLGVVIAVNPGEPEAAGIASVCDAAAGTGARIVLRGVSGRAGLAAARAAAGGIAVAASPAHLRLDAHAAARPGFSVPPAPPLRPVEDRDAMLAALADGAIDLVGSGGVGGGVFAPAILDLAVRGAIGWGRAGDLLAGAPARLFGIDARKGRIAPGADADLVLVDDFATRIVAPTEPRSPFEGFAFRGWPMLTVRRGRVIAEGEKLTADAPTGQPIARG